MFRCILFLVPFVFWFVVCEPTLCEIKVEWITLATYNNSKGRKAIKEAVVIKTDYRQGNTTVALSAKDRASVIDTINEKVDSNVVHLINAEIIRSKEKVNKKVVRAMVRTAVSQAIDAPIMFTNPAKSNRTLKQAIISCGKHAVRLQQFVFMDPNDLSSFSSKFLITMPYIFCILLALLA
ncbi:Signal peptide containing protein [Caenorhabditis elegans]|uniref:Signal peptide containing protein n=1 Tax=Caenorhabditis elegans TaxID=6239 RepID=Q9TXX1_CAEEL|nr:Signal peptide containing protein [Caenorhabditis elegans]CCD70107.1 Signal peptide containing protein [Caenorhabditis elegans]|eukprot:NP_493809.1 Uncharacterized protein CELE_F46F5.16 [Caenorhabditis elegans]